MICPRCGTETESWPCPECGFPEIILLTSLQRKQYELRKTIESTENKEKIQQIEKEIQEAPKKNLRHT